MRAEFAYSTFLFRSSKLRLNMIWNFSLKTQIMCSIKRGEQSYLVKKCPGNVLDDLFFFKTPNKCAEGSLVNLVVF